MGSLRKHYGCPGSLGIPFFNKTREEVAAQVAQASSTRLGELGCFLLKQPRFQNVMGCILKIAIYTPSFTKSTPLMCFSANFFLKSPKTLRIPRGLVSSVWKWSKVVRILANNGPRKKLGYDICPFLLIFYRR